MSGSLYLFPRDPWQAPPATDTVLEALRGLNMLGSPHGEAAWLAGDGLLRQITFAGCSPHLEFEPPADGGSDFCHLALLGPYPEPRPFTGPNTLNPRCPACKTRVADWHPLVAQYATDPQHDWTCPACGKGARVDAWRWRHHAVFGRLLVEIRGVFPAEGVPSDELLQALAEQAGQDWDYGWAAASG